MSSISRIGNFVKLVTSQGAEAVFNANYGGILLSLKRSASDINVVSDIAGAGEGFQAVADFGGDTTTGSCNGPLGYPVAPRYLGPVENYYAKEIVAGMVGKEAFYGVSGIAPVFWTAADPTENIHTTNPANVNPYGNWSLKYNNILGFDPLVYDSLETPIFYSRTPQEDMGIILLGDEIKQYYPEYSGLSKLQKVSYVKDSTISYRGTMSLRTASSPSWCGIMFRKNLTGLNPDCLRDEVNNAPGYSLTIGKEGNASIRQMPGNIPIWEASAAQQRNIKKTINTEAGVRVELRTSKEDPAIVDLFLDGAWITTVICDVYIDGAFGFIAQVFSGYAKFACREMFDVSSTFTSIWHTNQDGSFGGSISYRDSRAFAVQTQPLYRMNNPVVFIGPSIRDYHTAWKHNGSEYQSKELADILAANGGTMPAAYAKACYAGRADKKCGVFLAIRNQRAVDSQGRFLNGYGHWFLNNSNIAFSPLVYANNLHAMAVREGTASFKFGAEVKPEWL